MRNILLPLITLFTLGTAHAQITITAADMPVSGDKLCYSNVSPLATSINLADTGAGITWFYADLTPISQAIDTYRKAFEVNPIYASTISLTATGYKVADSIPGISMLAAGLSLNNIYTFFEKMSSPPSYAAVSFTATVSGLLPVAFNYTSPDVWYFFPLTYGRSDSSDFDLDISLLTFGGIQQKGYRKTRVDAWGSIMTPYFTTPKACLRVRSELNEIDSVRLDTISFGLPRTTVEYKWLVQGQHYPALWVTTAVIGGVEIPTMIRYKDVYRGINAVHNTTTEKAEITAYPNPATGTTVTIDVPASWKNFFVEVFDIQGRLMTSAKDERQVNVSSYASGNYMARIMCGEKTAYVQFVK